MTGWMDAGVLLMAGLAAGVMNAVAGGGTILTFPALLALGLPAIPANATSTFALVVGTLGSAWGFRNHVAAVRPWLVRFGLVSVAGGVIGAWLLTVTPEESFSRLVPFLVLLATVLFLVQGVVKKWAGRSHVPHAAGWGAMLAQFFVAIYGGYFGAGIGILMLAVFGFMGFPSIHEMNALKNLQSALINVVAAVWFMVSGLIAWREAGVLMVGATAGYFLGAHYSQKIPEHAVRFAVGFIGLAISAVFFWRQFTG